MKQIIKFGTVGTIGFIVDATVLLIFVEMLFFSIEMSRIASFLVAVFMTWILNRNFTFSVNVLTSKRKEYFLYLTIQTFGAILNYIIFISLVYSFIVMKEYLILPLAISSLIVMFFNIGLCNNMKWEIKKRMNCFCINIKRCNCCWR